MATLNRVMIIGRLGRDIELKYTQSGIPVAKFSVATDESYSKNDNKIEKTEWHNIQAWHNLAENCAKYLNKGQLVFIEGKLQTRKWQDKNGNDRYQTEIVASNIQFLSLPNGKRNEKFEIDYGPEYPSPANGADDVPF